MADSVTTFVRKTTRFAGDLDRLERRMAEISALTVKRSVLAQMQFAGVQGGKLRGVGKRGAKVGVRYDLKANSAYVRATGPLHLLERNTKAHRIPRQRKTTRAKKRLLVIPGVGVRAFADHPGTRGKHPWAKGVAAARPVQERAHREALGDALRKAYT